ncbi:hypothetical protein HKX48_003362 [Thoreauomyces humboldtii]|nr:hypothetical protein HKX48_003362 [Thoreauomyces humboldtii]
MGAPIIKETDVKLNLGHQEVSRIIEEIEKAYTLTNVEWLPAAPIAQYLADDLGYEDEEEFKDALGGSFTDLLNTLPDVETQLDAEGNVRFRVTPEPPREAWKPRVLTFTVTNREQLWRVLLKSPCGNHVGNAIFELGAHVRTVPLSNVHTEKIGECIGSLNDLLDVPCPWQCRVVDPSGISRFSDMTDVVVTEGMPPDSDDEEETEDVEGGEGGGETPAAES